MVFNRDLRVTILGNAGVGKTTLIKRLKGDSLDESEKTTVIQIEKKRIKLLSQKSAGRLNLDRYRYYNIIAIDTPGDFTLRRQWRVAMAKFKSEGIIFMLDPTQDYVVQRTAMEDAFNYYLDSLDMNAQKADKIAVTKRALFYFIVNKIDLIDNNAEKAQKFIDKFADTLKVYYGRFPKAEFRESYISVHKSDYKEIDNIFETIKSVYYETQEE